MKISVIDSYFSYVAQQMNVLGAQVEIDGSMVAQPMAGVANAQDWPQVPVSEGALWFLFIQANPVGYGSQAQVAYEYFCQWVWLTIGSDIGSAEQARNRGNRWRADSQIMDNLRQANYPGFCFQRDYSANAQGVVTSALSASQFPESAVEIVRWTSLKFRPKPDITKSGVNYNAAAVELYGYSDVALAVA